MRRCFNHTVVTRLRQMPIIHSLSPLGAIQMLDVPDNKNGHRERHEKSVKNVQEDLVRNKIPGIPLQIFNDSKNAAHKNDGARDVEYGQITRPGNTLCGGDGSRALEQSNVKEYRRNHEETKNNNLNEQTSDDDLLASLVQLKGSCGLDSPTSSLKAESNYIAGDKDSRHPLNRDQ